MFRFGREDFDDFFATGHLPELTPQGALEVLEAPAIPFDRRIRDPISTLKHHLLPQTHPYNCLQHADEVLRFENLEHELSAFCVRQRVDISLKKIGASRKPANALRIEDLTAEDLRRIRNCYLRDFIQLGYPVPMGLNDVVSEELDEPPDPWPVLRFYLTGKVIDAQDRLPNPECDLQPFLSAYVTAEPGPTWAGRKADLTEHFLQLEHEFHGRPRLAHLLACVIVALRRNPTDAACRRLFDRIVREFGNGLVGHLNLRWLTSVCDTFMDVATDPLDRATALAGSLLASTIKLSETERRLFHPPQPEIPLYRFSKGGHLFDGVITFWVGKGDMITNLLSRAASTLENAGAAAPFTGEIIVRALEEQTVWRRMMRMQEIPGPEMAPPELVDRLRKQLSKRDG
jgi:hypothetical protein